MDVLSGWGTSAICVGYLVDVASQKSLLYDYSIAFNVMLVCWIADAVVIGKLSVSPLVRSFDS